MMETRPVSMPLPSSASPPSSPSSFTSPSAQLETPAALASELGTDTDLAQHTQQLGENVCSSSVLIYLEPSHLVRLGHHCLLLVVSLSVLLVYAVRCIIKYTGQRAALTQHQVAFCQLDTGGCGGF